MTKHSLQINDHQCHQCLEYHAHIVIIIFHLANMSVNNEEHQLLLLLMRGEEKKSVAMKIKLKGCEMKRLKMMFQENCRFLTTWQTKRQTTTTIESAASSADHPPVLKFI